MLERTENLFLLFYLTEIILKVIGLGLISGKKAFLKDLWNIFDLVIIIISILNYLQVDGGLNLIALRSLKVLRPLKTISIVKKFRNLIETILSAIPYLLDIALILIFMYLVFAISGMHLFHGVL